MFRNWLRSLFSKKKSKTSKTARKAKAPPSFKLGLEVLERRELLSATSYPGFSLVNGNLYNTAISQTQPIDTEVQNFGVRSDGNLFELNTNNDLTLNSPSSGNQLVDFGTVQGFAMGQGGAYFVQNDNLNQNGFQQPITIVTGGVQSVGVRSDGNLFVLHNNNDLTLNSPSGNQLVDFGVVQGFAMGQGGAYFVQNGNLNQNGFQQPITIVIGGVKAVGVRSDGNVYVEHTNNDLTLNSPAGTQLRDFGAVIEFGVTGDGRGYYDQSNGVWWINTVSQNIPVQDSGERSDGAWYLWFQSGDLFVESDSGVSYLGFAQSFAVTTDGRAYYEATNGSWYINTAGGMTSLGTVQATGTRSDGATYLWFQNGDLIVEAGNTVFSDLGTVQSFAVTTDGRAYYEQTDGSPR
jgi:hypothetical protein